VYFDNDLQNYVLVDQGSQNGTVVNGNQILQVSTNMLQQITNSDIMCVLSYVSLFLGSLLVLGPLTILHVWFNWKNPLELQLLE